MSVQEQTPFIEYECNGFTKVFPLSFDCSNSDHLIVQVDDIDSPTGEWVLSGKSIIFHTAPKVGSKLSVQRNTPLERTTEYNSYDNSMRPPVFNHDFDRIWWKLQELGLADWLIGLRLDKEIKDRIAADIYYYTLITKETDYKINELKKYIEKHIYESDQNFIDLKNYIDSVVNGVVGENFLPIGDQFILTEHQRTLREKNGDFISLHDYCKLDGTDETLGFLKAVYIAKTEKKKLVTFYGKIRISSDINLRSIACDISSLDIICLDSAKLIIGGDSRNGVENPDQFIGSVRYINYQYDTDNIMDPTIMCVGAKNQHIRIRFSQYTLFYQSTDPLTYPVDASQAYSTFDINYSIKIVVDTDPRFQNGGDNDGAGSRIQWFNENTFNLGRCIGFYMRGNYNHNANIINGGSFEGKSKIYLEDGGRNKFKDIRFEGTEYEVYCGARTDSNLFEKKFHGSTANFWTFNYKDFGQMNMFRTTFDQNANIETVLNISSDEDIQFDGKYGNYNYRTPSKTSIKSNSSGTRLLAEVSKIKFSLGDYLLIYSESLGTAVSTYIATVDCYDKLGNLIDLSSIIFDSGNFKLTSQKGRLEGSFNTSSIHRLSLLKKNVIDLAYIDLRILSAGDISKSKAKSIIAKRVNFNDSKLRLMGDNSRENPFFSLIYQKPSALIAPIGSCFQKYDGSEKYICAFSVTTSLITNADASALTINIKDWSVSGFGDAQAGDLIGVELNNGVVHWTKIISISLGSVVLKSALLYSANKENLVYISRLSNF